MIRLDEGGQHSDLALIPPPPALRHVVEHFWVQKPAPQGVRRVVPDLSPHLVFWTRQTPRGLQANCFVVGARSTFCDINTAGRALTIGVRLRPGALPELVRDSAAQLTDRSAPLQDIAGRAGSRLLEQIVDTPPREAVARLAEFVSARLASRTLASRTTARFDLPHRATSVFELAQALRTSRRSVYNRLTDSVGLAPKRALRIHRLHTALLALNQGRSLAEAAATAAYSDQAHFSREAAQLLGEPPGAWRRRRNCSFVQDTNRSR